MSIAVSDILNTVFSDINEPNGVSGSDGRDGNLTRIKMLEYLSKARRRLQRKVGNLKAEFRIQAESGKILYDYPFDFKSNLHRIEYDNKPLSKTTLVTLDDYDSEWRSSTERTPRDDNPRFYVLDEPSRKFLIYPPPGETGTIHDFTEEDGIPESIGSVDLTTEDGIPETVTLDGEEFVFALEEGGIVEEIIPQSNNLKLFYYKHLVDLTTEDDVELEDEFESLREAVQNWMKALIFSSTVKKDVDLAKFHFQLVNDEIKEVKEEIRHLKPTMRMSILKKPGRHWGRRGHEF